MSDDGYVGHYYFPKQKSRNEVELEDAVLAANLDDSVEHEYVCERVLKAAWKHASDALTNPFGVASVLPWNMFENHPSRDSYMHCQDHDTFWNSLVRLPCRSLSSGCRGRSFVS